MRCLCSSIPAHAIKGGTAALLTVLMEAAEPIGIPWDSILQRMQDYASYLAFDQKTVDIVDPEGGLKAAQHLDVIVRNKFRTDKPSLSAWDRASHIERNNGKSKDRQNPNQGTTDTDKAKSSRVTAAVRG